MTKIFSLVWRYSVAEMDILGIVQKHFYQPTSLKS